MYVLVCQANSISSYDTATNDPNQQSLHGKLPSLASSKSLVFASFLCFSQHVVEKWPITWPSFIL